MRRIPSILHLMVVAALGGLILTLAHPSATRQFTWPWVLLLFLLWIIPLVSSLGAFAKSENWILPNRLLSTGFFVLTLATLLSAASSPFSSLSTLRIWPTFGGVAIFLWVYRWLKHSVDPAGERAQLLGRAMASVGAILSITSLISWRWTSEGQIGGTRNNFPFGHSTYTAGILILLLPWLVNESLNSRGVRRFGWIVTALTGIASLLATSSRGGVLALAAGGMIGTGYILTHSHWPRRHKVTAVCLVAGIVSIAVLTNPRLREVVYQGDWGKSSRDSNSQRSNMIEAGYKMGLSQPWTGYGPGTVPLVYPQFRSQLGGGLDNVLQLHNTPVQLWATLGAGGILSLLMFVGAGMRRWLQLFGTAQPEITGITAAVSVIGYGLFILTDHQLDLPAMNVALVLNLTLFFQNDPAAKIISLNRRTRQLIGWGTTAALVVPFFLTVRDLSARLAYDRSLDLFEAGKPDEGKIQLGTAAERAPYDPYYRHQIAGRLLAARIQTSDPLLQSKLTAEAIHQLQRSINAGCFLEFANLNLGWLTLESAKPSLAAQYFIAAAQEAPYRSGVYFGLGLALRDAGNASGAVRAFALEWINDPIAFTAPVWEWPDFAPLRVKVEREADTLLSELASKDPRCLYVQRLWKWWSHGTAFPAKGFDQESDSFVETLQALANSRPWPATAENHEWSRLFTTWKQASTENEFSSLAGTDSNFSAALQRRKMRHPFPDWRGFLTSGVENEASLIINSRAQRLGYGILALHPDGPILTDLYIRQQDRIAVTFASSLFPAKGWIPASELVNRLPALKIVQP